MLLAKNQHRESSLDTCQRRHRRLPSNRTSTIYYHNKLFHHADNMSKLMKKEKQKFRTNTQFRDS